MRPVARLLLEIIAAAVGASAVFGAAVVLMQTGLPGLTVGCVALIAGIFAGWIVGAWFTRVVASRRLRLDVWLATWAPAAAITARMLVGRWPIRQKSSDAHGWGMNGGESNVLLLPVVQLVLFVAGLIVVTRFQRAQSVDLSGTTAAERKRKCSTPSCQSPRPNASSILTNSPTAGS